MHSCTFNLPHVGGDREVLINKLGIEVAKVDKALFGGPRCWLHQLDVSVSVIVLAREHVITGGGHWRCLYRVQLCRFFLDQVSKHMQLFLQAVALSWEVGTFIEYHSRSTLLVRTSLHTYVCIYLSGCVHLQRLHSEQRRS